MKSAWFRKLLDCPEQSAIMADFSVPNLWMVPMAPGFKHSRIFGYPLKGDHPQNWNSPEVLHKFYGDQSQRVVFVINLREPLERMQSEWYHTRKLYNCIGCMMSSSFAKALKLNAKLALKEEPEITDWMWKSMYARQIEEYIKIWDPSQFIIIPFRRYVSFDTRNVSTSLIKRLHLRLEPWSEAAHDNEHEKRPPLTDEAPEGSETRNLYYEFMVNENKRLVEILAGAHLKGMELEGYTGRPGDADDTWQWLQASW